MGESFALPPCPEIGFSGSVEGMCSGSYKFTDGDTFKYVGEFKGGKFHGRGTFIDTSGKKYRGEVEGRQEMSGTEYDRGDKVVSIWSDGEISERQT